MGPEHPPGTVDLHENRNERLNVGDSVMFYDWKDPKSMVGHRIIEVSEDGQRYRTKGDANRFSDLHRVRSPSGLLSG